MPSPPPIHWSATEYASAAVGMVSWSKQIAKAAQRGIRRRMSRKLTMQPPSHRHLHEKRCDDDYLRPGDRDGESLHLVSVGILSRRRHVVQHETRRDGPRRACGTEYLDSRGAEV